MIDKNNFFFLKFRCHHKNQLHPLKNIFKKKKYFPPQNLMAQKKSFLKKTLIPSKRMTTPITIFVPFSPPRISIFEKKKYIHLMPKGTAAPKNIFFKN